MINYPPIAIICYRRAKHLSKLLLSLSQCNSISKAKIYFFIDYPKDQKSQKGYNDVLNLINKFDFSNFQSFQIIKRKKNFGLRNNVILGVNEVLKKHNNIIVLEDDIEIINFNFYEIMHSYLNIYELNKDVWHIASWNYPITFNNDVIAWRIMECWGWATWRDKWAKAIFDPVEIKNKLSFNDKQTINLWGGRNTYRELTSNITGKMDTWAIMWLCNILINKGICISFKESLVINNGLDNSGSNCSSESNFIQVYDANFLPQKPSFKSMDIDHFSEIKVSEWYKKRRGGMIKRIVRRLKRILKK